MDVLEGKAEWSRTYQEGWLAHLEKTGKADWKLYQPPRNHQVPGAPGIRLSESRLMLISSAGGYLRESQTPFDAASPYGDYTIRTFPTDTPLDALAYGHNHYDHKMIDEDPQVALPLGYLIEMVEASRLGSLVASVVSFMGYQPDSGRVVDEMIPYILELAEAERVGAALLAPV